MDSTKDEQWKLLLLLEIRKLHKKNNIGYKLKA